MLAYAGHAETPSKLIFRPNLPGLAVFETSHQSYALGCEGLALEWKSVPHQSVSADEWNQITSQSPVVADVYCDNRVTKFNGPPGTPGGLIIKHRDGHDYIHMVDDVGFHYAISGNAVTLTTAQEGTYIRGIDFNHSMPGQSNACSAPAYGMCLFDRGDLGSGCHCGCYSGTLVPYPAGPALGPAPILAGCDQDDAVLLKKK